MLNKNCVLPYLILFNKSLNFLITKIASYHNFCNKSVNHYNGGAVAEWSKAPLLREEINADQTDIRYVTGLGNL